jgi:hypothetical protein
MLKGADVLVYTLYHTHSNRLKTEHRTKLSVNRTINLTENRYNFGSHFLLPELEK